ncbi:hypothetical protein NKH18_45270 [Streptomyces sp. M10(2022)]
MVAPLEDLGDPGADKWRNHEHFQMVLHNTLAIITGLSLQGMAGNLEAMTRTGFRIGLVDPGRFTRGYYHIWIDAELTNRSYLRPTDSILRHSAPGVMNLDESQYGVQGSELGVEVLLSSRDAEVDEIGHSKHGLTAQAGYQRAWQKRDESAYGSTVTFDPMAVSMKPGHFYTYDLSLTVSTGGYWRPRSLLRGMVTFGILGMSPFVRGPKGRGDIIGGESGVPAVQGKVLLSVPSEHSPTRTRTPRTRTTPTWSPISSPVPR